MKSWEDSAPFTNFIYICSQMKMFQCRGTHAIKTCFHLDLYFVHLLKKGSISTFSWLMLLSANRNTQMTEFVYLFFFFFFFLI